MKTLIFIIEANYDEVVVTKLGDRQYLCESIAEDLENLGIHNSTFSYCKRVKADGSQDFVSRNPVCSTKRGGFERFQRR